MLAAGHLLERGEKKVQLGLRPTTVRDSWQNKSELKHPWDRDMYEITKKMSRNRSSRSVKCSANVHTDIQTVLQLRLRVEFNSTAVLYYNYIVILDLYTALFHIF